MHTLKISRIEWVVYGITYLFLSLLIFKLDDDTQPLIKLLHWQYTIPVALYAGLVVLGIMGLSQLLKFIFRKPATTFAVAIVAGTIFGLKAILSLTNWIFN